MRLSFSTKSEAQVVADRIFASLQWAGKLEPRTTAWAIPYQDLGKDGKPIDTKWHVAVDGRARSVMTKTEVATITEWKEESPTLIDNIRNILP